MAQNNVIHVTVHDLNRVVYDGDATAVSSVNDLGPFDILAQHGNFISIVKEHITIHTIDGKKVPFTIDSAVLKTRKNEVTIFLGVGSLNQSALTQPIA